MNPKKNILGLVALATFLFLSFFTFACGSGEDSTDGDDDKILCEYSTECPTGYYCGAEGYCVTGTDGDVDQVVDGDTEVVSGIIFRMVPADSVDFGDVSVGGSPAVDIIVYNDGNQVLHLQDANFLEPVTDNPWSLVGYAQAAIQPGSSFSFKLKFNASELGEYSGKLQIRNDSDNNAEAELILSGKVVAPMGDAEIATEHEEIAFEDHEIGVPTVYETVLIGNTGALNSTVYITGISMQSGTDIPFELELDDDISEDAPVAVLGSSSYKGARLWFRPNALGEFSDNIVIKYYLSNDSNSATLELPVSGKAVIGSILIDPLQIDFGTLTKNQEKTIPVSIVNHNPDSNVTVQTVRINNVDSWSDIYEFTDKPGGVELEPSKSVEFSLTFNPITEGDFSGELAVATDDNGKTYYFPIYAEAVAENQKPIARVSLSSHGPEIVRDVEGIPKESGVSLYGDISYDPDGDSGNMTFAWSLQKPTGSTASISDSTVNNIAVVLDKAGDYFFTLVVTDEDGTKSDPKIVKVVVEPDITSIKIEASYSGISHNSDVDLSWTTSTSICSEDTASSGYCQSVEGGGSIRINACGSAEQCTTETVTHINAPAGDYGFGVRFDEDCPGNNILVPTCTGGLGTQSASVTIRIFVDGDLFQSVSTTLSDKGDSYNCTIKQAGGDWYPPDCSK